VQHFNGTGLGCFAVVTPFPIAPEDSLVADFEVVAFLMEVQAPFAYVIPPPVGEYTILAAMQVQLPDIEALLVVGPPAHLSSVSTAALGRRE
jgi:hypothetical protein